MSETYDKGIFVMDYLKSIGFDFETIADAICDENLAKSYEIIIGNPTISKHEFIEKTGIEYDEEEISIHEFLCHLQMHPCQIAEAMNEDNYDKTLEIMQTRSDISREDFLNVMQFTDKYKEQFTYVENK